MEDIKTTIKTLKNNRFEFEQAAEYFIDKLYRNNSDNYNDIQITSLYCRIFSRIDTDLLVEIMCVVYTEYKKLNGESRDMAWFGDFHRYMRTCDILKYDNIFSKNTVDIRNSTEKVIHNRLKEFLSIPEKPVGKKPRKIDSNDSRVFINSVIEANHQYLYKNDIDKDENYDKFLSSRIRKMQILYNNLLDKQYNAVYTDEGVWVNDIIYQIIHVDTNNILAHLLDWICKYIDQGVFEK